MSCQPDCTVQGLRRSLLTASCILIVFSQRILIVGTASHKHSSQFYKLHLNGTQWINISVTGEFGYFWVTSILVQCAQITRRTQWRMATKHRGIGKLIGTFTSWAARLLGPEATITLSCLAARRDNVESMQVCACVFKWWRPQVLTQLTVQCKEGTRRWLTRLNQSMKGGAAEPSQIIAWFAVVRLLSILNT